MALLEYPPGLWGAVLTLLLVQWVFLPGYLCNTTAMLWGRLPKRLGRTPWVIDGGRVAWDGHRWLGDGKTWAGLVGGALSSGLLAMIMEVLVRGRVTGDEAPFVSLLAGQDGTGWYVLGGDWGTLFVMGTLLGFGGLFGDLVGSFVKRRRGLKREGGVSSRAPLLDTLSFAVSAFVFGVVLLPGSVVGDVALWPSMLGLLILTPIIHRAFNIIGYRIGWKDVPY